MAAENKRRVGGAVAIGVNLQNRLTRDPPKSNLAGHAGKSRRADKAQTGNRTEVDFVAAFEIDEDIAVQIGDGRELEGVEARVAFE